MALSVDPVFEIDATFEAVGGYLDQIQEYCELVERIASNIVVSDPNVKVCRFLLDRFENFISRLTLNCE